MTQDEIDSALEGKRKWEERLLSALRDYRTLNQIVEALAKPFANCHVHKVACLEALGFPIGAGVALALEAGLVLVRKTKPAHLSSAFKTETFCDYDGKQKTFKVLQGAVPHGTRILIVDDLYERGEQLRAAITLLTDLGATVMGAAFIHCRGPRDINLDHYYKFHVHHLNCRDDLVPY